MKASLIPLSISIVLPFIPLRDIGAASVPAAEQQAAFEELAATSQIADFIRDEAGNYRFIRLEQSPYKEPGPMHPGLRPEQMKLFRKFPKLEAVTLRGQLLPDEAYQVLGEIDSLRLVCLADVSPGSNKRAWPEQIPEPTGEYIRFLEKLPNLEVLDLEHSFRIDRSIFPELPAMPKLRFLCVDTVHSKPDLLEFLSKTPNLHTVRLHRTDFSNEDIAALLERLPHLEYLYIKPGNGFDYRGLAHLSSHSALKALRLGPGVGEILWENGLEHLVQVESLEALQIPVQNEKQKAGVTDADLQRLRQARPDLVINEPYREFAKRMTGYEGIQWRWGRQPQHQH